MSKPKQVKPLPAQLISPENFQPYGQVIYPMQEEKPYDSTYAQLLLSKGTPCFYIMRLARQGRKFYNITRHVQCTQCLGSLGGKEWFIAVAPPSDISQPNLNLLCAFRIPGNCFIKLEAGTWHAGPHFEDEFIDFYNLQLSDTNITDYESYNFLKHHDFKLQIV
ncbi:ureidoglycolate lyase [Nostoc muscorum FACHB-395]|nr:ureidoglycolate lyase [Desmonostoc muscorum FACHB-395]